MVKPIEVRDLARLLIKKTEMNTTTTPRVKRIQERNRRITALYDDNVENKDKFPVKMKLYMWIGDQVGCCPNTVISALKASGRVQGIA